MNITRILEIAERARGRGRLSADDQAYVREIVPKEFASFPRLELPKRIQHPGGFPVSGAPVGTFLRSGLLVAAQRVLERRYEGSSFYEGVEKDVAFGIMRSHFHHGYPKGTYCCTQCTLACYPVLKLEAIRYFECAELAVAVEHIVTTRQWRFAGHVPAGMLSWAMGQDFRGTL